MTSEAGAELLECIGKAKAELRDVAGALTALAESRRTRQATGTLSTPAGAALFLAMGRVQLSQGHHSAATASFKLSHALFLETGSLQSPDGAQLLRWMAIARKVARRRVVAHRGP